MKLMCSQHALNAALSIVNRAVSPNNTLPVLNNIQLIAEGKSLSLRATNLEIAITASVEASIQNEGALTVPAKTFMNYISLIQDEMVELSTSETTLNIASTGSETSMKGISSEEFPLLPKIKDSKTFKISTKGLQKAIQMVVFAASTNIARPVLTGLYWQVDGKQVCLAATDSYRLAEKKIKSEFDTGVQLNFILPSKTAQELSKALSLSPDAEHIDVSVSKGQILFTIADIEIMSRLIEGNYPDYEKILPKEVKTYADLSTEDFILGLKKVSVIVKEGNNNIKATVGSGKITISSDETQVGQGSVEIPVNSTGEQIEASLNVQYLLDVLSHLNTDRVHFGLNDRLSPVRVTPVSESDYTHIIMPLKV